MIIVYVIALFGFFGPDTTSQYGKYPAIMIAVTRMIILLLYQPTQASYPKSDFFNAMLPFNVFDGFGNFG